MEKIWLRSYPAGVPENIDPDQYENLPAAIDDFCQMYAEKIAFSNFGTELTYRQLADYSRQLAAYFQQELALAPGERVALMMPNILQYPVVLLAILRAGLVVVNVNPLYTAPELKRELLDCGAKTIIVLDNFAHVVAAVLPEVTLQHVIVTQIGDLFSPLKAAAFNLAVKYVLRLAPRWRIDRHQRFKRVLKISAKLTFKPPLIKPNDIAFLQYTGGTTGVPKGAMLSHRNLIANILQCKAWISGRLELGKETLLAALPLYHIFSLTVSGLTFLALGGHCVLVTNPRDIGGLVKIWKKSRPTAFIGLNTLFLHLMKNPQFNRINFQRLKLTVGGGMATQAAMAEQWQDLTGCVITEGYGLTEASPVVTISPADATEFKQSIGLPVPSTNVKICDDHDQEVPLNAVGELWAQGPQVMVGYWQHPAETAATINTEGWLKTGDMVRMDDQGFIYLVNRKKDLIIVSGFNVYPSEIEAVIAAHPGVADVAVFGEASNATGEMVKAVVVKKDPQLTAQALIDFCRQELTAYKIPKKIEFVEIIPKSPLGKILHHQ